MTTAAQTTFISTKIGKIAVHSFDRKTDKLPVILLHGVYFDHHLWDQQATAIQDRTIFAIDMPLHGESREITTSTWTLTDCADMLIELLDSLQLPSVIAVGHSWGSMTILRAASRHPQRFEAVGLCNMPFQAATCKQKALFRLQHSMLKYRNFYTRQAAKALFGKTSLKEDPGLLTTLRRPMSILSNSQVRQIDKNVIIDAEDTSSLIIHLQVKAIALKGKEDYVPTPRRIETWIVDGGHVSPIEAPEKVIALIRMLANTV
jgi:3-oxoadipate enol-lactonase